MLVRVRLESLTYDFHKGVVEKRLTFPGRVHELTFTDDSRHLITGNANATIYVVRLQGPTTK